MDQSICSRVERVVGPRHAADMNDGELAAGVRGRDHGREGRLVERRDRPAEGQVVVVHDLDVVGALCDSGVDEGRSLRRRRKGRDGFIFRSVAAPHGYERPRRPQIGAVQAEARALLLSHRRGPLDVRGHVEHRRHAEHELLAQRRAARMRVRVDQPRQQRPPRAVDLLDSGRRRHLRSHCGDPAIDDQHRRPRHHLVTVENARAADHERILTLGRTAPRAARENQNQHAERSKTPDARRAAPGACSLHLGECSTRPGWVCQRLDADQAPAAASDRSANFHLAA